MGLSGLSSARFEISLENAMKVSARNIFPGKISRLVDGPINAEVEITTPGGDRVVAIVTEGSVQSLGLAVGREVIAYVKAPWVMVLTGVQDIRFSARNQLAGTVTELHKGAVNTEVGIQLSGGTMVYAVITNEAVMELGLKEGVAATALIKASHVVLGVPA
jgi:molybdate transport system regulatory protein